METFFSWQAPEYIYNAKGGGWYAALGILTMALLILAYLLNNFLFGVLIIISSFALALYGARRPKTITFALTAQGIRIADRLYPYDNIRSFWIHYNPPMMKEVTVIFKRSMMPRLSIPLDDADPNDIRDILIKYADEKPHDISFIDTLGQYLRF